MMLGAYAGDKTLTKAAADQKIRSGTQWTEDDYAKAGYRRLGTTRFDAEVMAALDRLVARAGTSRVSVLAELITSADKRAKAKKKGTAKAA